MLAILQSLGTFIIDLFKSRRRLDAENLLLRHQLSIALRRAPPRLRLRGSDQRRRPRAWLAAPGASRDHSPRWSLLDLRLDLGDAPLDIGLLAGAADDRGVLLVDHHFFGSPEHIDGHILKLDAEVLGNNGAAREDRNVLKNCLAAIAEAGGLHRRGLEAPAQLVDHEGG